MVHINFWDTSLSGYVIYLSDRNNVLGYLLEHWNFMNEYVRWWSSNCSLVLVIIQIYVTRTFRTFDFKQKQKFRKTILELFLAFQYHFLPLTRHLGLTVTRHLGLTVTRHLGLTVGLTRHLGLTVTRHLGLTVGLTRHLGLTVTRHLGLTVTRHLGLTVTRHLGLTVTLP